MKSTRQRYGWAAVLCLALVLAGACRKENEGAGAGGPAGAMAPEVRVYRVVRQSVQPQVELPGRTASYRVAEVRPQVNGILLKRLFTEGSEVKEGQVLYQIDPALYRATVESAQAQLAQAVAQEYSTRQKAARYQSLVQSKAVSVQDQVEMEAAWKQAQAAVAAAKAALATAKINLDYTEIKAPISGRIGKSMVSEGALVTAQQATALASIQQIDPLYVDLSQAANILLELKRRLGATDDEAPDTEVRVLLDDGQEYQEKGRLEFSDITVDQGTGSVTLRAIVPNPDRFLLPGMFIRARLISASAQELLLVPQSSIIRTSSGAATVLVVGQENSIETRVVATGQSYGAEISIEKGLKPGERIIVSGLQKVQPGMMVTPVEAPAEAGGTPAQQPAQTE